MTSKTLPCPTVLRQLLRYEPDTGKLFWVKRDKIWFSDGVKTDAQVCSEWNKKYAEKEAFTAVSHGYHVGRVFDRMLISHRVAWAIHAGRWPNGEIDHINGVKADNRIANLRDVTTAENGRNKCLRSNNTSGYAGVSFSNRERKWKVLCWENGKAICLGSFENLDDAVAARKAGESQIGYHINHGRPAEVRS